MEGPPIPITIDMVKEVISQTKAGKAPGPSGIMVEMIRQPVTRAPPWSVTSQLQSFMMARYPPTGSRISLSASTRIRHWKGATTAVSSWQSSCPEKIPGEDCEWPQQTVGVNQWFPVWLCPRQRHNKRKLYCQVAAREVSSGQQEALHGFHRPEEGVWSSALEGHLRKLGCGGVDCATGALSCVHVGEEYSEEFEVKVGVHQGSILSLLLFIMVLEVLSCEFRSGVPWEDLYADDLVIIAKLLEECVRRLLISKEAMEEKGLRLNAGKMKIMICGTGLDLLQSSGEFPCAVCCTRVGSNSIFCNGCKETQWTQALDTQRTLITDETAHPLDGRP